MRGGTDEDLGINRNIVECKDNILEGAVRSGKSINRNIVECKVGKGNSDGVCGRVLIET